MLGLPCPRCRQPRAEPSRRRRVIDWVYRIFKRKAYRCRFCGLRFFALERPHCPPSAERDWSMEVNLESWYPTLSEGWELFEKDVLAVRDDCLKRGVGYMAYCIPFYVSLRDDAWELHQTEGVRYVKLKDVTETEAFFEREEVPYVDVTTALASETDQSQVFHHPDGHLKKEGAWIVAREIRDYLVREVLPKEGLLSGQGI